MISSVSDFLLNKNWTDQKSNLILPFNIAAIENNMLPVVNNTIPMIALPIVTNRMLVNCVVTYLEDEKNSSALWAKIPEMSNNPTPGKP